MARPDESPRLWARDALEPDRRDGEQRPRLSGAALVQKKWYAVVAVGLLWVVAD